MAYQVSNIIPVNVLLTPSGISYANFSSAIAYGVDADLQTPGSIAVDAYKDYASLDEVKEDFTEGSPPELVARRWFANIPTPPEFTVWLWDDAADTMAEVAAKAKDEIFRYWHFFPAAKFGETSGSLDAETSAIADWSDANNHPISFVTTDPDAADPQISDDIVSLLQTKGNRHVFVGYREAATVSGDASQEYANAQLAAAFYKFRPEGQRTAITGEYQVLPGVVGEELTTTEYNALKSKNAIFWTAIELQGSTDASRTINTKSMSSFGEFMDDVVNIDVLRNRLQVDGYNYIANAGSKRPLTPKGFAGLLSTIDSTLKQFYDNGVLGQGEYTDPATGETAIAKYGYVIRSEPTDVFDLSDADRRDRKFPPVSVIAILARAGHTAEINITVE